MYDDNQRQVFRSIMICYVIIIHPYFLILSCTDNAVLNKAHLCYKMCDFVWKAFGRRQRVMGNRSVAVT